MPQDIKITGYSGKKRVFYVTTSSGEGYSSTFEGINELMYQLIITSSTSTTTFKVDILESDGTKLFDGSKVTFTGYAKIAQPLLLIGDIKVKIYSASADEQFTCKLYTV